MDGNNSTIADNSVSAATVSEELDVATYAPPVVEGLSLNEKATDETNLSEKVTALEVEKSEVISDKGEHTDLQNVDAANDKEDRLSENAEQVESPNLANGDVPIQKADADNPVDETDAAIADENLELPKKLEEEESEGEIVDSDGDEESVESKPKVDYGALDDVVRPDLDQLDYDEDVDDGEIKNEEEKKTNEIAADTKELSDGEVASSDGEVKSDTEEKKIAHMKMAYDDYEEGEMVDASGPAVPREICRFFERGSCSFGDRCRFIHPGVNDKGGYQMFEDKKPRPPAPGPPARFPIPIDPRGLPMPPNFPPPMMHGPPPPETAWERGLRHAKEMRRRAMQRKVEEPDFQRKREVLSLNEALNVDRDMDYIAHKPLAEEETGVDPFNAMEEDERYAVPSLDEIKKYKRFDKSHKDNKRSPNHESMRRPSPSREHYHREMHERSRERRSPPRHPGAPPHYHDRHQPLPMTHHTAHVRHDYRDKRDAGGDRGRNERELRRPNEHMKERDYRMEGKDYPGMDSRTSPKRRDVESRVVPVQPQSNKKKSHSGRGDAWNDPWARGRQAARRRASRSDSESSGSTSSSSRSSYSSRSGSSYSSRSSSRSSYSSSFSSSASSRSPSPKKIEKKPKSKKVVAAKTLQKVKDSPKAAKSPLMAATKQAQSKKTAEMVKAKLSKNEQAKPPPKIMALPKPSAKETTQERGRPTAKIVPKKTKQKRYSSSSSEFSHSSSSESRSRSRGKDSESGSESGSSSSSSSGSDSYSSSSSSSGSSDEEDAKKPKLVKKKVAVKRPIPAAGKKAVGKVPVPIKPGNKELKMTIGDKASGAKSSGLPENRKRPAPTTGNPPAKKVSAAANRRVELLEQLKVVEKAILKKRAKLT